MYSSKKDIGYGGVKMEEEIVRQVAGFIAAYRLQERPLYAGVSGGADSMALLLALQLAGYRPVVLHVNFSLRGEESDGDEAFVREYCAANGITCICARFDTAAIARESGKSIEMAARDIRYGWFQKEMQSDGALFIAHNADDMAETVLLNMCRGTGLQGMCGIREKNGDIYRPLLSFRHARLEAFLERHGVGHREDRTNGENCTKRNIIRNRIFPILREINPRITDTMLENCRRMQEVQSIFKAAVNRTAGSVFTVSGQGMRIHPEAVLESPAPATTAHELFSEYGFSETMIADMLALFRHPQPGKVIVSDRYRLLFEREGIYLYPLAKEGQEGIGNIAAGQLADGRFSFDGKEFSFEIMDNSANTVFQKSNRHAYLDWATVIPPLSIRHWRQGDKITPFGMKGRGKLVSDLFNDNKFNRIQRENTLLLCDREKILWVAGLRSNEQCRVKKDSKKILHISVSDVSDVSDVSGKES